MLKKPTALFLITFLLSAHFVFSQNMKFGKVSKEELQEKFYPLDSNVSAAYLFKYRKTYFEYDPEKGFYLTTDIHERIKIYSREGFDNATKSNFLYKRGGDKEIITKLKGITYNLIDNKVEEIKLKKGSIFNSEYDKYRNSTKFTMPNIKIGSVIEYKYTITSPFYSNIDEFVFQSDIPIKKLETKFEVPEYFNFKPNTKGFLNIVPEIEARASKLQYKQQIPLTENRGSDPKTYYREGEVEFSKDIIKYSLSDIPALIDEPHVNNINNYRSAIKYELSYTNYPGSALKYYNTTWDDVTKTIYRSAYFGEQLEKNKYFMDDLTSSINLTATVPEKIISVFQFVKSKIKWNGYNGKYTSKGVKKAYKDGTGNVAEVNLTLVAMLRKAGLSANPILVSTRSHGIPLFPTSEGFNYVIAGVEIQNNVILLDATEQYSLPNVLPLRDLNWRGRIVRQNGSSASIDLFPKKHSSKNTLLNAKIDENGILSGIKRTSFTNLNALNYRKNKMNLSKEDLTRSLEEINNDIEISDVILRNKNNIGKPVIEQFKFKSEDQIEIADDKIYFSPLLFLVKNTNPFKLNDRKFPIDFGTHWEDKIRIGVQIPQGYTVKELPENMAIALPDNLGSFKYAVSHKESKIELVCSTKINFPIISAEYYEIVKGFYSEMIKKQTEKIVLTKK